MISRQDVARQIRSINIQFAGLSLSNEQNFHVMREVDGRWEITVKEAGGLAIALRNVSYREIYGVLDRARMYNLKMLDGALIQMLYTFDAEGIAAHRLAFFPSPDLEDFQNDPEPYLNDDVYADILNKNIVPFPIRFDYKRLDDLGGVQHPQSHLTLGQYVNCRIPVSAPVTPFAFADFVLRNFYNTVFMKFTDRLNLDGDSYPDCITNNDRRIAHLRLRENSAIPSEA